MTDQIKSVAECLSELAEMVQEKENVTDVVCICLDSKGAASQTIIGTQSILLVGYLEVAKAKIMDHWVTSCRRSTPSAGQPDDGEEE